VTRKCILKFPITTNFIDEVELDVVPLDIYGIILGSPYLYDRKAIFHCHEKNYRFFKEEIEYIIRVHCKKLNVSLMNVGQMKRLVNASHNFALLMIKHKYVEESEAFQGCCVKIKHDLVRFVKTCDNMFQESDMLPPKRGKQHVLQL